MIVPILSHMSTVALIPARLDQFEVTPFHAVNSVLSPRRCLPGCDDVCGKGGRGAAGKRMDGLMPRAAVQLGLLQRKSN